MASEKSYEEYVKTNYSDIYTKGLNIIPHIPDQRNFYSDFAKSALEPWDLDLIWQTLAEELVTLEDAENRGDIYDMEIYEILKNANKKLFYELVNRDVVMDDDYVPCLIYTDTEEAALSQFGSFKPYVSNFMATYPVLSYLLIEMNKIYQLAVFGNHYILTKEIGNSEKWRKINSEALKEDALISEKSFQSRDPKITRLYPFPLKNISYAFQWIIYCDNLESMKLLLSDIDLNKNAEDLLDYCSSTLLIQYIWTYLDTIRQKKEIDKLNNLLSLSNLFEIVD